MNKSELIEHIARQADISKAAATRALEAMIGGVKTSLKKNTAVSLVGFGTFTVGKRAAATACTPGQNDYSPANLQCQDGFARQIDGWTLEIFCRCAIRA